MASIGEDDAGTVEAAPNVKGPKCRSDGETYDECVARKIPELIETDGMPQKQAIAVARSMCETKCSDKTAKAISESVKEALSKKAKEHNKKVKNAKTKKTTTRTLGSVFLRGIGAYSTNPQSVRPTVSSAEQWAYARVNSFLFVLRNGKFRSGKHDTDLLPKGHPQSSKSIGTNTIVKGTNFPKAGDDKKVSLRNSKWPIFPSGYAATLKKDWPQIWKKGGNILGNTQYSRLTKVLDQGGSSKTPTDEKAIRLREAWMARHLRDHRLAGVVAQIKWLGIGSRGLDHMKSVINKEKARLRKNANGEKPSLDHDHYMSEASFDLTNATSVTDESKWADLEGSVGEVEIHYRMITPFAIQKAVEGSNDVTISGPVYVGNAEMLDRHNELVDTKAIMDAWENYSKNPVILYNHSKTYGVIGKMTGVKAGEIDGVSVPIGTAIIDGGEKDITRKIRKGFLKAFSIGFIAKAAVKMCEDKENCYMKFTKIDWVETSVVDVPASPNALFSVSKSFVVGSETKGCGCGCKGEKEISKERVGEDEYTTPEEAAARAEEIGCSGSHTHDKDGETIYMPCGSMDAYRAIIESEGKPMTVDDDDDDQYGSKVAEIFDSILDRLTDIEDSISDQTKDGSGDSLNSRLDGSDGLMDTHETDIETIDEMAEATEEESSPVMDETPMIEVTELSETETIEEKSVEEEVEVPMPKPSEVLMEIGSFMKSLEERLSAIEAKFAPEAVPEDMDLKAALAEKEATIADMIAEKEAVAEAEAIEAEIQSRVDAALEAKGHPVPSRKSASSPAVAKKSSGSKFDPQPIVSKGTNGLANWLEANLSRRA